MILKFIYFFWVIFPGRLSTQITGRPPHLLSSPQARGGGVSPQQHPLSGPILQQHPAQRGGEQGGSEVSWRRKKWLSGAAAA